MRIPGTSHVKGGQTILPLAFIVIFIVAISLLFSISLIYNVVLDVEIRTPLVKGVIIAGIATIFLICIATWFFTTPLARNLEECIFRLRKPQKDIDNSVA